MRQETFGATMSKNQIRRTRSESPEVSAHPRLVNDDQPVPRHAHRSGAVTSNQHAARAQRAKRRQPLLLGARGHSLPPPLLNPDYYWWIVKKVTGAVQLSDSVYDARVRGLPTAPFERGLYPRACPESAPRSETTYGLLHRSGRSAQRLALEPRAKTFGRRRNLESIAGLRS